MIKLAVVNKSKTVPDTEVKNAASGLRYQAKSHYGPAWSESVDVTYFGPGAIAPPANYWQVEILDVSDVQGALGYHEFSSAVPLAKVFAKTCKDDGVSWTSCASHEILEMLTDPSGSLAALNYNDGCFYSYEVCDAVEQDSYNITTTVGTSKVVTEVSNFVLPAWFNSDAKGPYDYRKKLTAPFQLLPGGSYIEKLDVSSLPGWKQITARSRYKIGDKT